jgi:hypothetical protein
MKLAPAIEEFIQYKRALGNLYIGPANILKAFLRKTGDLDTGRSHEWPLRGIPAGQRW